MVSNADLAERSVDLRNTAHEVAVVDVGRRLRHFRVRLGLTQETVANAAKLSTKFLSQIENGHVNPSIGVLARVVHDGLGLTLGVVFTWEPPDGEVSTLVALLASQSSEQRRKLIRVIEVLCDGDAAAVKLDSPARSRRRVPRRRRS